MDALTTRPTLFDGAWRSLAWLGGALAAMVASAITAVLAVFFTAALAVVALMGAVAVGFAGLALRARRSAKSGDPDLIDARRVGGNSWVAYGWDQDGRKA
jgi:type IV secretory pathway TrbD component